MPPGWRRRSQLCCKVRWSGSSPSLLGLLLPARPNQLPSVCGCKQRCVRVGMVHCHWTHAKSTPIASVVPPRARLHAATLRSRRARSSSSRHSLSPSTCIFCLRLLKKQEGMPASPAGLAKEVAWDAQGARCLVEVEVLGAPSQAAARAAALGVAGSADVCDAVRACDPDWAAIIEAARCTAAPAALGGFVVVVQNCFRRREAWNASHAQPALASAVVDSLRAGSPLLPLALTDRSPASRASSLPPQPPPLCHSWPCLPPCRAVHLACRWTAAHCAYPSAACRCCTTAAPPSRPLARLPTAGSTCTPRLAGEQRPQGALTLWGFAWTAPRGQGLCLVGNFAHGPATLQLAFERRLRGCSGIGSRSCQVSH
jgi:hypothetical protein